MMLPAKADRGIVVFWVWPSLPYETRLLVGFVLVAASAAYQILTHTLLPGIAGVAAGNLLFLARGYDNRVDVRGFDPDPHWEPTKLSKLEELQILDKKIRKWNRSAFDVTNVAGVFAFLVVVGLWGILAIMQSGLPRIVAIDALVLLVPHWVTGTRSILRSPSLLVRIEAIKRVLDDAKPALANHSMNLLMLRGGDEAGIPTDVKFKVNIKQQAADFLGLYGQLVINEVQGRSYPYFYAVLVARDGFGLHDAFGEYEPPAKLTKEFKRQGAVEVFVIRQQTTKTSGYHTSPAIANLIFAEGLKVAERVATGSAVSLSE